MTNKKSNPVMTPEWLVLLLSVDVVPPHLKEDIEGLPMPDGSVAEPTDENRAWAVQQMLREGVRLGDADLAGVSVGSKEAFDEMHRKRQAEEIAIEEDWRHDPVLLSLSVLLQSLGRGNFEQARQETQTINRCLAVGASPNPVLLSCMLRDLIG